MAYNITDVGVRELRNQIINNKCYVGIREGIEEMDDFFLSRTGYCKYALWENLTDGALMKLFIGYRSTNCPPKHFYIKLEYDSDKPFVLVNKLPNRTSWAYSITEHEFSKLSQLVSYLERIEIYISMNTYANWIGREDACLVRLIPFNRFNNLCSTSTTRHWQSSRCRGKTDPWRLFDIASFVLMHYYNSDDILKLILPRSMYNYLAQKQHFNYIVPSLTPSHDSHGNRIIEHFCNSSS
jgi:hypothetical protein